MDRINAIIQHPLYQEYYKKLENREKDRIFCRHQMEHLLDVARIAYISSMEQGLGIEKELIYAAALLHDIGKYEQYENGIPHEIASAEVAEQILKDLSGPAEDGFSGKEIRQILSAIRNHRDPGKAREPLERLIYQSDKLSRNCFACPAEKQCNWEEEKKNRKISI